MFFGCSQMEAGPCKCRVLEIVVQTCAFQHVFLRMHSVQSVIHNPMQLSGRRFPYICYIKYLLSSLYVFGCSQMEAGPCKCRIVEIVVQKICVCMCFFRIHCVQSVINNPTQFSGHARTTAPAHNLKCPLQAGGLMFIYCYIYIYIYPPAPLWGTRL